MTKKTSKTNQDESPIDLALIVMSTGLCPYCAGELRSNRAQQCPHCGSDWHDEKNVEGKTLAPEFSLPKAILERKMDLMILRQEYKMSWAWLHKTQKVTLIAAVVGGLIFLMAFVAFLAKGPGFLDGSQLVIIISVLVFALLIYISLVFGRIIRLRLKIAKTGFMLNMSSEGKSK